LPTAFLDEDHFENTRDPNDIATDQTRVRPRVNDGRELRVRSMKGHPHLLHRIPLSAYFY
jgi:hypothetical protein